eukprot:gb/GFBE01007524.1/.p1 GENE.gb/GFBE01007524.1/~~gb/GFBE01007524.1/.p1  ORF type:complete len:294 (+),score=78.91 gb/GFBE01007524.1/:1-882(+)
MSKGWGKGGGKQGGWQKPKGGAWQEEAYGGGQLSEVVSSGVQQFMQFETEWDSSKLEKKISEYIRKAAKNLSFNAGKLPDLINEFADNFFGSMFASLGDRDWLYTGQADFIHILDAGIKELFPVWLVRQVAQEEFQNMVLEAHDRAFEEQRFGPILTDAVNAVLSGPKIRKKVWNSIDAARKEAAYSGADTSETFAGAWIDIAVRLIAEASGGDATGTLSAEEAARIFHQIMEGGGIPLALTQERGPPPPAWPLVDEAVHGSFAAYSDPAAGGQAGWAAAPPAKRFKGGGKGW